MATDASSGSSADVLGAYIRAQRQLADLSLRQLAGLSNVSNAYLSQIERGLHQPSLKVLRSISRALNLSAETLLAQAGLIDTEAHHSNSDSDAEAAILADPDLTQEQKQVLVGAYRSFRQQRRHP
jgi:transcriptional regulator with XRE-family HTH domain